MMTEAGTSAAGKGPRRTRSSDRFTIGQEVLARWSDGLFYLGNIVKIDETKGRCYIRYEDDSEYWTLFKDVQKGVAHIDPTADIYCKVCNTGTSESPNEIVLCDSCGMGYHQLCHKPVIQSSTLKPDVSWVCRNCVFATTAKRGGADKSGPNATALQEMKQSLPYNLYELTWDSQHKVNAQQCYCYCGGPGDWYLKMLQCCRCRQWFHEACIQCLEMPLIYGDRFYIFVCSFCNSGPEYIKRLELKQVDILHLALFDLTIRFNKKYYDLDEAILPWISNHLEYFVNSKILKMTPNERKKTIFKEAGGHRTRFAQTSQTMAIPKPTFKSGREIRKKTTLFGLRMRAPPQPLAVQLPTEGRITDSIVNKLTGKRMKSLAPPNKETPVPLKCNANHKRRTSTDALNLYMYPGKKRFLSECSESSNSDSAISFNQNYVAYSGLSDAYLALDESDLDMDITGDEPLPMCPPPTEGGNVGSKNLLRRIIPWPKNFKGINHPFRTTFEKSQEIERNHAKMRLLKMAGMVYDFDECASLTGSDYGSTVSAATSSESHVSNVNAVDLIRSKKGRKTRHELQILNSAKDSASFIPKPGKRKRKGTRSQSKASATLTQSDTSNFEAASVASLSSIDSLLQSTASSSQSHTTSSDICDFRAQARRILPNGKVEYLMEWKRKGKGDRKRR